MLKHFPGAKEETEFITFVKELIPMLSSSLKEDDYEVIDKVVIQIKNKAKTLGLEPGYLISTEVTELWEMLKMQVKKEIERSLETTNINIPEKEMLNILETAFARYPAEMMTRGLKDSLEEWLGEMKRWLKRHGYLPFPTDKSSSGFVHFGQSR